MNTSEFLYFLNSIIEFHNFITTVIITAVTKLQIILLFSKSRFY